MQHRLWFVAFCKPQLATTGMNSFKPFLFCFTRNTTIQFEVMEAPVNSKPTVVVLRSSKPVTWLVNGNALKPCNISFLVSEINCSLYLQS